MFDLRYAVATHPGWVRDHNEDSTLCIAEKKLYAVFDGVGGHNAGEVASRLAADTVAEQVQGGSSLARALCEAHRQVQQRSQEDEAREGMATTAVAVRFYGPFFQLGWAGDSRAYRVDGRGGTLRQLTRDHSFVQQQIERGIFTAEEAAAHPMSSLLVLALGQKKGDFQPEMRTGLLRRGQGLLLCSDGLTDMLPDARLRELALAHHGNLGGLVDAMIQAANDAGGRDNISLIYIGR